MEIMRRSIIEGVLKGRIKRMREVIFEELMADSILKLVENMA